MKKLFKGLVWCLPFLPRALFPAFSIEVLAENILRRVGSPFLYGFFSARATDEKRPPPIE